MSEQARQTDAYTVAEHIYDTFLLKNPLLTIEEVQRSSVHPVVAESEQASEIIAYRTVVGVAAVGQILRRTPDGEGYELVTKPKYRGVDHVRTIRRYGRDPVQKIVGSMFACELIRIVNERE